MIYAYTLVARLPNGSEKNFGAAVEAASDVAALAGAKVMFFDWLRENNAVPLRVEFR